MRMARRVIGIADDLLDTHAIESRVLRVEPDPRLAVELLPRVDVSQAKSS